MELHEEDLVKLINVRGKIWNSLGFMDNYCGKTVKVKYIYGNLFKIYGDEDWTFSREDVVCKIGG